VGASYGTRAALDYQRQFPTRVRRIVLDGVAPPDMVLPLSSEHDVHQALERVLKACEKDKACNARYPDGAGQLQRALARLPQDIELAHPVTLLRERVSLDKDSFLNSLRSPLYIPALAAALPHAISQAAAGDFTAVLGLSSSMSSPSTELAWAQHFSVVCAEDFPRLEKAKAQAAAGASGVFAQSFSRFYAEVCQNWPQAPVPAEFFSVKPSTVPALVLSGGADPVTPPRHGEATAKALGNLAKHVVVPNVGHGVMVAGCGTDIVYRFVHAQTEAQALTIDSACLTRIPMPTFFAPPLPIAAPPAGVQP
jgi:pimeloyl-ACP methyl ester carboxylesterase